MLGLSGVTVLGTLGYMLIEASIMQPGVVDFLELARRATPRGR